MKRKIDDVLDESLESSDDKNNKVIILPMRTYPNDGISPEVHSARLIGFIERFDLEGEEALVNEITNLSQRIAALPGINSDRIEYFLMILEGMLDEDEFDLRVIGELMIMVWRSATNDPYQAVTEGIGLITYCSSDENSDSDEEDSDSDEEDSEAGTELYVVEASDFDDENSEVGLVAPVDERSDSNKENSDANKENFDADEDIYALAVTNIHYDNDLSQIFVKNSFFDMDKAIDYLTPLPFSFDFTNSEQLTIIVLPAEITEIFGKICDWFANSLSIE